MREFEQSYKKIPSTLKRKSAELNQKRETTTFPWKRSWSLKFWNCKERVKCFIGGSLDAKNKSISQNKTKISLFSIDKIICNTCPYVCLYSIYISLTNSLIYRKLFGIVMQLKHWRWNVWCQNTININETGVFWYCVRIMNKHWNELGRPTIYSVAWGVNLILLTKNFFYQ